MKRMLVDNSWYGNVRCPTNMAYIYSLPTLAAVPLHPLGAHVEVHDLSTLTSSLPECPVVSSACPAGSSPGPALHPAGRCGLLLITSDGEGRRMIGKGGKEI